jgi:hypothetical protein
MGNLVRRADKQFVLRVFPGENHSLARKPNPLDYQRRILERSIPLILIGTS